MFFGPGEPARFRVFGGPKRRSRSARLAIMSFARTASPNCATQGCPLLPSFVSTELEMKVDVRRSSRSLRAPGTSLIHRLCERARAVLRLVHPPPTQPISNVARRQLFLRLQTGCRWRHTVNYFPLSRGLVTICTACQCPHPGKTCADCKDHASDGQEAKALETTKNELGIKDCQFQNDSGQN